MTRTIQDLLASRPTRPLLEVPLGHSASQAFDAMEQKQVPVAIVRDAVGHLVGLFAKHEAEARLIELCRDPGSTPVGSIMTPWPTPVPVGPELSLEDAARLMGRYGTRYLPVAEAGTIMAVVSAAEVAARLEGEDVGGLWDDDADVQRYAHGPALRAPETYGGTRRTTRPITGPRSSA